MTRLDTANLFAGLGPDEVARIEGALQTVTFTPGAVIIGEGDSPAGIFILVSGTAEVTVVDPDGGERSLGSVRPGDVIGEVSALTGEPATATVRAREEVRVRVLPLDVLDEQSAQSPQLVQNLGRILALRLARADRRGRERHMRRTIGVRAIGVEPIVLHAFAASLAWHRNAAVALVAPPAVDGIPDAGDRADARRTAQRVDPESEGRLQEGFRHVLVMLDDADVRRDVDHIVLLLAEGAVSPPPEPDATSVRVPEFDARERELLRTGLLEPIGVASRALGAAARAALELRVGVAFGGGAIRGWAHYGVLKVLERELVPVDAVSGTSVGAAIAAQFAQGHSADAAADDLDEASRTIFKPRLGRGSLLSATGMRAGMQLLFGEERIEELPLPLGVTATDLAAECQVVLRRGPVWQAVLASCAIPGIYPPQNVEGRLLVDGGVLDPVPSDVVAALGADIVIGIKLTRPAATRVRREGRQPGVLDLVGTTFHLMQGKIASDAAARAQVLVEPVFEDGAGFGLRRFREGRARYVELGEAAAEAALPRLAAALPWLASPRSARP